MEARRTRILRTIPLLIAVCFVSFPAKAQYGGGTGEPNDPYLIYTAEQMNAIGAEPNDWDKHFKLMTDINLSAFTGTDFNIIGNESMAFTGVFDGNGHTISNFSYISTDTDYIGLFGCVDSENAEIRSLGLNDPNIDAGTGDYVGSLAGWLVEGTITNCYVVGGRISGNSNVGGLVGRKAKYGESGGTITNCYSTGRVSGNLSVGGLVGYNVGGTITNCYATASVTGGDYSMDLGGLCGGNRGTISECYATGSVTAGGYSVDIGGLCGGNLGTISHCYAISSVTGGDNSAALGGLVGYNAVGTISNCFWDKQTCGTLYSSGGWGMSTADMMAESTYIDWNNGAWIIDEGRDYPHLAWENTPGTIIDYEHPRSYAGNGEDQPFELEGPEDIVCISLRPDDWDKNFVLTSDIDMSSVTDYRPVGLFTGSFDGQGHIVENLMIDANVIGNNNQLGLFGRVGLGGQVANLGLLDVTVIGGNLSFFLGGLCGQNDGTISDCYASATVSGTEWLGGLCGKNQAGTISNCYATGSVTGGSYPSYLGGLCGSNSGTVCNCHAIVNVSGGVGYSLGFGGLCGRNGVGGTISTCYATGSVTGGMSGLGGLCGENRGTISDCYATGSVTGGSYSYCLGGLCGENGRSSTISNCYATGSVTSGMPLGGLLGENRGEVTDSFWDIETSGQATSASGMGLTTAEMQRTITFLKAGWDFINVWGIGENQTYPYLRRYSAADINQDKSINFPDLAILAENWLTDNTP
ncbi:MAG: GLUG motif-containing protein [Planctomycetota bacterium]|jgi:hypothetical protein